MVARPAVFPTLRAVAVAGLVLAGVPGCGTEQEIRQLYPAMALYPEVVEFGDVVVPYTGRQQLVIQNAGQATLELELELVDDRGVFGVEADSGQVPAGGTWPVELTLHAETFLDYQAILRVRSNDPELDGEVVEIPLTGRGVDAPLPAIAVSPLTLDFGEVAVGSSSIQHIAVVNQGAAPLTLGLVQQEGSGAFQLTTDPSHTVVGPGNTLPVLVTYAPGNDQGDNGMLRIPSDAPGEPEVAVLLLGNGGGDFDYPVALIDCPGTSAPPQWVFLDGSGSYDPAGGTLSYDWQLVEHPGGSQSHLSQHVTDHTQVYTDLAGTYQVQLTVTNDQGATSAPDRCYLDAIPEDELHIELTWDTPNTDMDLHLVENDSALFEVPGDCNWCNPNPSWGAPGSADDPRLDLDDRSDGPENINILAPADGAYHVKVHYFSGSQGAVTATVRVYAYGDEVWSGSKVMTHNQVWDAGQVNWPDGTFGVETADPYDAPTRACY